MSACAEHGLTVIQDVLGILVPACLDSASLSEQIHCNAAWSLAVLGILHN